MQPSARRAYTSPEYEAAGVVFTDDVSEADCIVGTFITTGRSVSLVNMQTPMGTPSVVRLW